MSPFNLELLASAIEILLGITLLGLLIRAKEFKTYWPMLFLAMWQILPFGILIYLHKYGQGRHIPAHYAYLTYALSYWISFALEAVCSIVLTYTILHGAMAPLQGLQKLVKIVYFWAAAISVLIAVDVIFTPSADSTQIFQLAVVAFQRATGIITVSLAVFVCIAIRPMGLSLRSRVFGTSLGLVIVSVTKTLSAKYLLVTKSLYGTLSLVLIGMSCLAELVWIYYFAVPEPKVKFVLLSTTSPFHRWNQIAAQFGQNPGYVAIGGIPPEAFTDAEIEVFHRTSAKMKESELEEELSLPSPDR